MYIAGTTRIFQFSINKCKSLEEEKCVANMYLMHTFECITSKYRATGIQSLILFESGVSLVQQATLSPHLLSSQKSARYLAFGEIAFFLPMRTFGHNFCLYDTSLYCRRAETHWEHLYNSLPPPPPSSNKSLMSSMPICEKCQKRSCRHSIKGHENKSADR